MREAPEHSPTAALQHAFAAHLRDPERSPAPSDVEPRRMAVYADLFFNNVAGLLAANFPVIRSLHDGDAWRALVRAFYRDHRCHTPLFTDIAREFIRYLEDREDGASDEPPFLAELAHYEWSELALSLDESDLAAIAHDPDGDVVDGIPIVSPLARVLAYRFPVHRIRPDFQPSEPPSQPTLILLVRDRADELHFLEIDALTALLFERLQANTEASGRACLGALLAELGRNDDAVRESGLAILTQLRARDALLGTRRD
ncbi:MAG TPA: putative DNA-binding domain-containing protein [Rhodanobacteraceae bacterium]|nr:putative DNA-binding domain-containing protein [Rhodanobacteraceae bacterium]